MIEQITVAPRCTTVYNFEVEDYHTYYVSNTKVLVHNSDPCPTGLDAIPKPPKGKGTVAPNQRDPKRVLTKKEKGEMLDDLDGKCEGCGVETPIDDARAHHTTRHADGGSTTKVNTKILCKGCHVKIHQ